MWSKSDIIWRINNVINRILPKKKNKIVMYGRVMYDTSHIALIDYLIENNYNKKYKIILVCTDKKATFKYQNIKNVVICEGKFRGYFHTLTAKFIFSTHSLGSTKHRVSNNQISVNIWHGTALKELPHDINDRFKSMFTYTLCAGEFAEKYFRKIWLLEDKDIYRGGYPRCDKFFSQEDELDKLNIDINIYKSIVMYMPTYRKSDAIKMFDSTIDFPIFDKKNILIANEILSDQNILLLIKLHLLQNDLELFKSNYSNIRIIKNDELYTQDVNLYSLIAQCNCLITDYSSIYFDYLLTDKPIGFVIDDIDSYGDNRGFVVDNPLDYMPGEKIRNIDEMLSFIQKISEGNDEWKEERLRINNLVNYDQEGDYCKKLLDFVGIINE